MKVIMCIGLFLLDVFFFNLWTYFVPAEYTVFYMYPISIFHVPRGIRLWVLFPHYKYGILMTDKLVRFSFFNVSMVTMFNFLYPATVQACTRFPVSDNTCLWYTGTASNDMVGITRIITSLFCRLRSDELNSVVLNFMTEKKGFGLTEIVNTLINNRPSPSMATYYLLVQKLARNQKEIKNKKVLHISSSIFYGSFQNFNYILLKDSIWLFFPPQSGYNFF